MVLFLNKTFSLDRMNNSNMVSLHPCRVLKVLFTLKSYLAISMSFFPFLSSVFDNWTKMCWTLLDVRKNSSKGLKTVGNTFEHVLEHLKQDGALKFTVARSKKIQMLNLTLGSFKNWNKKIEENWFNNINKFLEYWNTLKINKNG